MRINIGGILTKRAFMTPDREALVCESIRRTYGQLNDRANRLANTMKALGVEARGSGRDPCAERTGVF